MVQAVVGLGSNIDRDTNIPRALAALDAAFGPLRVSSLYDTEAEGFDGPPFYNLAVAFETQLEPQALADTLRQMEYRLGRPPDARKLSSRAIDIDLLLYGDACIHTERLHLPRPEIHERPWWLAALAELLPEMRCPGTDETFAQHWAAFDRSRARQRRLPLPWTTGGETQSRNR